MYEDHPGEAAVSFVSTVPYKKANCPFNIEDCSPEPRIFSPFFDRSVNYTTLVVKDEAIVYSSNS